MILTLPLMLFAIAVVGAVTAVHDLVVAFRDKR
jgi:hypothetical protein